LSRGVKQIPPDRMTEARNESRLIALIMLIKLIEELVDGLNRAAYVVAHLHGGQINHRGSP
jgi:hypothetical protein